MFTCSRCGDFVFMRSYCGHCESHMFTLMDPLEKPKPDYWHTRSIRVPNPSPDSDVYACNGKIWFWFPPEEMDRLQALQLISDLMEAIKDLDDNDRSAVKQAISNKKRFGAYALAAWKEGAK